MNVLLVEDQITFRDILRKILSDWFSKSTVSCAEDGATAIQFLQSQPYTHLFIEPHLADIDGFEVVDAALNRLPGIRIIVFASRCNHFAVYQAERRNLRGFVSKRKATAFNLHQAIANISAGGTYFSTEYHRLKAERRNDPESFDKVLSDREMKILGLISNSFSDHEIASQLEISASTVEKHRFNILRKLSIHTTAQLARYGRAYGIAPSNEQRFPASFSPNQNGCHQGGLRVLNPVCPTY